MMLITLNDHHVIPLLILYQISVEWFQYLQLEFPPVMPQCLPQVVNPTKNVVSSQKIVWCDEKWSYVTGIILLEYTLLLLPCTLESLLSDHEN